MGSTPSGFIHHMKTAREWAHYLSVGFCIMSRGCHVTEEDLFRRNASLTEKLSRFITKPRFISLEQFSAIAQVRPVNLQSNLIALKSGTRAKKSIFAK